MESQGVNVEPTENTSAAGPDRKRRKLFHVYQQIKQLLGDLRVRDEADPTLPEDPAGPISRPGPVSGGEPETSDRGEDRGEASSGLDDHRGDPNIEPSEYSDGTSRLTQAPEMSNSEEISVQDYDSDYDSDSNYGRRGTPEEIEGK